MKRPNEVKLSPFERFLLFDHRKKYPMNFYIQIELEKDVDEQQFLQALNWLSQQHPRLRARIHKGLIRCRCTIRDDLPLVVWIENQSLTEKETLLTEFWSQSQRFPGRGVRFLVDKSYSLDQPSCRLLIEVFHPLFDGLFCMRILGELLGYLQGGEQQMASAVEHPKRDQKTLKPALKPTITIQEFLQAIIKYLTYSPAPIWSGVQQASRPGSSSDGNRSWGALNPSHRVVLSEVEISKLNKAAQQAGANLNAALVSCIFSAIAKLDTRRSAPKKKLRIAVPVSTLSRTIRKTAENKVGYVFLDRQSQDCFDAINLSKWVADSLQTKKARTEAEWFLSAIEFLDKLKWPLWLFSQLPLCHATAVVSNVGSLERWIPEGNGKTQSSKKAAIVKNFYGVPPIRPRTQMSIGITRIMDTIAINMLFDEEVAIDSNINQLIHLLENEIKHYSSH